MILTFTEWHQTFARSVLSMEPKTLHFKLINPSTKESAFYDERTPESCKSFLLKPIHEQEHPSLLVDPESDLRMFIVQIGMMESRFGPQIITSGLGLGL